VPAALTTIDCVVAPVDHTLPLAELDVSVTLSPAQNVVGPDALIVGVAGATLNITFVVAFAEQPFLLTMTDSVTGPVVPALYVIAFVPAPAVIAPLVIDHT
jgi:hypothetical protein